jgi:hypothetical protein
MKGRLFTFGCSFTEYKWPTWADLLGQEFQEYYNFGQCGGGNLFIACSIAEANARYKFTPEDTVLVMWTNVTREDRYLDIAWFTPGNILNSECYPEDFKEKFITIKGCYVRDLALISATDNMLMGIDCDYHFMSVVDMDNYDQYENVDKADAFSDITKLYKTTLSKFKPSVHKVVFGYDWWSIPMYKGGPHRQDPHPMPLQHIEYINKVLPEFKFSGNTLTLAKEISMEVEQAFMKDGSYGSYDGKKEHWVKKLTVKNNAIRF